MSDWPPLESARLKIDRAYNDVRTFTGEVEDFLETKPFVVSREVELGGTEHAYYVEIRRIPPGDLGTAVGNVLHNLRSALDSIVYDLSLAADPTLTEDQKRSIGFPIALEEKASKEAPMRFASGAAQEEIRASQPYNGDLPVRQHPLWLIHELNRLDKHRFVQVVPVLAMGSYWTDPPVPVEDRPRRSGSFETGAELARFIFAEPHPEVDIDFHPMFTVALPNDGWPAGLELRNLTDHIRDKVLPRFERFFR